MAKKISRRSFFNKSTGLGAGLLFFKGLNIFSAGGTAGKIPTIVTDHTNKTGNQGGKSWLMAVRPWTRWKINQHNRTGPGRCFRRIRRSSQRKRRGATGCLYHGRQNL